MERKRATEIRRDIEKERGREKKRNRKKDKIFNFKTKYLVLKFKSQKLPISSKLPLKKIK